MSCTDPNLHELIPCFIGQIGILQGQRVQTQDHVHGGAHLMAHAGEKRALGAADLLDRDKLRLHLFVFEDAVRDAVEHPVHDKNKDAAAEQDAGDDKIRLAEKTDSQVADQKQNQQHDGDIQDPVFAAPVFQTADTPGKAHKTHDIVNHQKAAQIDKAGKNQLDHRQVSFQGKRLWAAWVDWDRFYPAHRKQRPDAHSRVS